MDLFERFKEKIFDVEKSISYLFKDKSLLISAFTHRSFVNEVRGLDLTHNERLEFLGDSVLGLVMAEYLYAKFPKEPEGRLSEMRSRLVDASSCASYLQSLGLCSMILLGKGERMHDGGVKVSIQADVFEALVAALYLDGGIDAAKLFLMEHFEKKIEQDLLQPHANYKADLQDFSQRQFQKPPRYQVLEESGPEHAKNFLVAVFVNEKEAGRGMGHSKKEAEQKAAFDALSKVDR